MLTEEMGPAMEIPRDLRYSNTHEWIREEGDLIVVGITDYAQSQLSDLTYVELPSVGDEVSAQDEVAVVESVKAASDIYAPVSGVIAEINEALTENPEAINQDPYESGWLFKMKAVDPSELDGLLNVDAYEDLVPNEE
jgi:glycine cleavage system H protein